MFNGLPAFNLLRCATKLFGLLLNMRFEIVSANCVIALRNDNVQHCNWTVAHIVMWRCCIERVVENKD